MPGLLGAAEVLDPAAADREKHDHVEAAQPDRVDGEEVTGEDGLAVGAQEGAPRLPVALRRRRQTGGTEDVADGSRRDGDADLAQLTHDPLIAPARVLAREPQDLQPYLTADRRSTWSAAPKAKAHAERWVGSVRRECLDRLLIVGRRHLEQVLRVYVDHYNRRRPHRALDLKPPDSSARALIPAESTPQPLQPSRRDLLGGLIHEYEIAPAA